MSEFVVAVDLGTSKVACVAAELDEKGAMHVLSLAYGASQGVERGVVTDPAAAAASVESSLGKIERHLGTEIRRVWCSVGGNHLMSHVGQGMLPIYPAARPIKRQDVHQVLHHSRQVLLPPDSEQVLAVPREFVLDGERGIADPVGLRGSRLEVSTHIVTGGRIETEAAEEAVTGPTRRLAGMVPSGLASGLGVLSQEAMDLGAVVIDIGAGKTDMAVFMDGAFVFNGVVRVGSDHFSHDIAQLLKTDFDEAERLKTEYGDLDPSVVDPGETVGVTQADHDGPRPMKRQTLCEILESRGNELCQLLAAKFEESGFDPKAMKTVVLTGGGSKLSGTVKLFSENMPLAKPKLAHPKVQGRFSKQVATPMLSAVVGVARYALHDEGEELAPVSGLSTWKDRISTIGKKLWFGEKG